MRNVLVVAPHPDDETFGCGGTILKHVEKNEMVFWLIMTDIYEERGFSRDTVLRRKEEVTEVSKMYRFHRYYNLAFPTTCLDNIAYNEIIRRISDIFQQVKPEVIYLPYRGDVHTDHRITFDTVASCTKWFRYPSIKRVLSYETLSETDFGISPDSQGFKPNVFNDIGEFIERKIEIMKVYSSELGKHPFPRSEEAIRALATLRGAACGCKAAEAFMLLKEIT